MNGVQQPMEVQLFHWNTKYTDYTAAAKNSDGLAAVSFFYEVSTSSADNPEISEQISVLEELIGGQAERQFLKWPNLEKPLKTNFLSQLLPTGGLDVSDDYFYYSGSLTLPTTTAPTCTCGQEGATRIVGGEQSMVGVLFYL